MPEFGIIVDFKLSGANYFYCYERQHTKTIFNFNKGVLVFPVSLVSITLMRIREG